MSAYKKRSWSFASVWFAMSTYCFTLSGETLGIIGGVDANSPFPPMAALITSEGGVTKLDLSSVTTSGLLYGVAMNNSGTGVIVGLDYTGGEPPFAAFISPSGVVTALDLSSVSGYILNSIALNDSGIGLLGGHVFGGSSSPVAVQVSSLGILSNPDLSSLTTFGYISSVALNNSGTGLIGGLNQMSSPQLPLAALISSSGVVTELDLSSLPTSGSLSPINSVALNSSGTGLIGGGSTSNAIAALISPSGGVTALDLSSFTISPHINSVALNESGAGFIGGYINHGGGVESPVAVQVSPSGVVTNLDLSSLTTSGYIQSVMLNDSGVALIGGQDNNGTQPPLAALVSSSGGVTKLDLSSLTTNGSIQSVSLNDLGYGLIGGKDNIGTGPPMAALISPVGAVTKLDLSSLTTVGSISSVAIFPSALLPLLSHIPTPGLTGNNSKLANYINVNAPENAFYFVPSELNGTLSQALENAAPTRNAISVFTAGNNLFSLNTSFSRHSQTSRQFRRASVGSRQSLASISRRGDFQGDFLAANSENFIAWNDTEDEDYIDDEDVENEDSLVYNDDVEDEDSLVYNHEETVLSSNSDEETEQEERPYEIWGEVIGATSYQKAQHQTPGFEPVSGGFIFAFDAKATTNGRFGAGAAYIFTHIHERQDAGHSNINQEYLFLYGLWDNSEFYFDGAVWGGLFQSENVRKISMTSFDFQAKSHPKGWQLAPHAEFGYDYSLSNVTFEPFVMLDWISNWQWSYKETGDSPFNFQQKSHYSSFLRSELGLRFYETITFSSWRLGFKEKASYVYKKPFKVGEATASLVGAPGSFTVDTFTTVQNLGVAELEIFFEPIDPSYPYGTIDYQGEFGSKYQSHQVALGVNWSF